MKSLKEKLEEHYKYFVKSKISPDPLEFPHRFVEERDIELSGFISSVFAYGNIKQIMISLEKIHSLISNQPNEFILKFDSKKDKKIFNGFKHRFYTSKDILELFIILNTIYQEYGSLKNYFYMQFNQSNNIKDSIHLFSKGITSKISKNTNVSHGFKFMFPDPNKGSAAKRMNLFLRWMVRKDELDFGIWDEIPTSELIIPVDTHVAKISRELKLTNIKNVSWKMAEEITNNLKKYDAIDPVKYDFAICHIGMRKIDF